MTRNSFATSIAVGDDWWILLRFFVFSMSLSLDSSWAGWPLVLPSIFLQSRILVYLRTCVTVFSFSDRIIILICMRCANMDWSKVVIHLHGLA